MGERTTPDSGVTVVGATSRVGRTIAESLVSRWRVIGMGRSASKLETLDASIERRQADFSNVSGLRDALKDAQAVVVCAKPRFIAGIIAAIPPLVARVVIVGSTRRFSAIPGGDVAHLRRAEEAFSRSGLPGVILHPTMIYGAIGENNVHRIAAFLRRCALVPLPSGMRSAIQMIHIDDVVQCVEAALLRATVPWPPIVIAGSKAVGYPEMIQTVGTAIGRKARIIPLPIWMILAGVYLARLVPGVPRFEPAEVRRLLEDKSFPVDDMHRRLGVRARPLAAGLSQTFGADGRGSEYSARTRVAPAQRNRATN